MPRPYMVFSILALFLVFLPLPDSAQSTRRRAAAPAPVASVEQMVAAAQAESALLKAIYQAPTMDSIRDKHPRSRIGLMVMAAKQYEFNAQAGGTAVLAALPANSAEIEALRRFCAADTDLAGLERYLYGAALESVSRRPDKLTSVLRVASAFHAAEFPGQAETGGWYCTELAKLRGAMPQQYDRAASQEPAADRAYLTQCGAGS